MMWWRRHALEVTSITVSTLMMLLQMLCTNFENFEEREFEIKKKKIDCDLRTNQCERALRECHHSEKNKPRQCQLGKHVVKEGESLGQIAQQHGVQLNELIKDNQIANPDRILVGQSLNFCR